MIDFISGPVSIGFTSAAAIIIATTQVKDILGLERPGSEFLLVWEQIFQYISETRPWDCILGLSSIVIILILRVCLDIYQHALFIMLGNTFVKGNYFLNVV